jgi:hypothetical protein
MDVNFTSDEIKLLVYKFREQQKISDSILSIIQKSCDSEFFKSLNKTDSLYSSNVPQISFYLFQSKWVIGKQSFETLFDDKPGFNFIHLLLQNESREVSSTMLRKGGIVEDSINLKFETTDNLHGQSHKTIKTKSPYGKELRKKINEELSVLIEEIELIEDKKRKLEIDDSLNLEEKIPREKELNNRKEKIEKEISLRKTTLNEDDNGDRSLEKDRTYVQKEIEKRKKIIIKTHPYIKTFLNRNTIFTGNNCKYILDILNPVKWILFVPVPEIEE